MMVPAMSAAAPGQFSTANSSVTLADESMRPLVPDSGHARIRRRIDDRLAAQRAISLAGDSVAAGGALTASIFLVVSQRSTLNSAMPAREM